MAKSTILIFGALGAFGVLVVAAIGYSQWLNVPPTAVIPTPVLPSPNGHDVLFAATKLIVDSDSVDYAMSRKGAKDGHVFTLAEKQHLVSENEPALAAMRAALKLDYWNPPARSFTATFPMSPKFREMARLVSLEEQVKAGEGDSAGAVRSGLDCVQMGITIPRGGVLIADLVGFACEAIGEKPIWPEIDHLDAASATADAQRLLTLTDKRFSLADVLQEEKWLGQAGILPLLTQHSHFSLAGGEASGGQPGSANDDGSSNGPTATQAISDLKAMLTRSKRQIFADYTATMDAHIARAKQPFDVSAPPIPIPDDPINKILTPSFDKTQFKDCQIRMQTGLLTCALALRAYRARHNDYPNALAVLVADAILPKVPADPFGRALGTSFGYRRLSADKYLLYSVGPDGIDDGGKPVDNTKSSEGATVPASGRIVPEITDKGDWVVGVDVGNAHAKPEAKAVE